MNTRTATKQNTDQILDVDLSQLHIRDGTRKRIFEVDDSDKDNSSPPASESLRRSGRKRIRPLESDKRRVFSKPKKILDDLNAKNIVNYYLDKKVKRLPSTLETIFEETNSSIAMSSRKFKRLINFSSDNSTNKNKSKVKKRVMKAKQVPSRPKNKVSMESLLQRLSRIEHSETPLNL